MRADRSHPLVSMAAFRPRLSPPNALGWMPTLIGSLSSSHKARSFIRKSGRKEVTLLHTVLPRRDQQRCGLYIAHLENFSLLSSVTRLLDL